MIENLRDKEKVAIINLPLGVNALIRETILHEVVSEIVLKVIGGKYYG